MPLRRTAARWRPRRLLPLAVAALLVPAACGGGGGDEGGTVTLKWYVFDEPSGAFDQAAEACTEASEGRYRIETAALPADADQQREQLVRRLAAEDSDIDIIGMDVIWTAEFAEAGWILPWEGDAAERATEGRLEPAVESATYQDRLWAAPFTSNTQLLWYRKDLVDEPPATWGQLLDQAQQLADEGEPHLVQVQGERYEGLVVWFTSLLESAGTSVLNEDGTEPALEEEATRRALEVMRDLSTSSAADPTLSTSREDQTRLAWEAGNSAFMVNYTFVWPSAQQNQPELAENMGWARWPGVNEGEPSHVTIGGINLGVGAYSDHPDLAREAAACIAGDDNQVVAAEKGGLLPSSEALYDDAKVQEAFPFADVIRDTLADAVQRPQTPFYNDVALAIARTLHPTRSIDPEGDVQRLRDAIAEALEGQGLL
ncbi:MAG TPA: ABC transporter substrate-binding protein [Acidimicrobiales bacterium]|jgi:multiple sugar transport system substrate-binding protein